MSHPLSARRHAALVVAVAVALTPLAASALPAISAGEHVLLPDRPNQRVAFDVAGGDAVEGLNLYVQVADGGPDAGGSLLGPAITDVDILSGTIFATNNLGQFPDAGNTRQVFATVTLTHDATVPASGRLATVTFDTRRLASGTWTLTLDSAVAGTTDFAGLPAALSLGSITIPAGTAVRTADADGTWADPAHWADADVPNAPGRTAHLGPNLSAPRTVSLTAPVTVGTLELDSAPSYTLAGPAALTLSDPAAAKLDVQSGAHTLSAPLVLASDVLKTGPGTVTLTGSVSGPGNLTVTDGRLVARTPLRPRPLPAGDGPATGSLVVAGPGASVSLEAGPTPLASAGYTVAGEFAAISASAGTIALAPVDRAANKASVLVASSLTLTGTATLDLGTSDLVLRTGAADLANLRTYLASGALSASGVTPGLTTLALLPNDARDGSPFFSHYDGVTGLTAADLLVKFTYVGDTNLDGRLDGTDFAAVIEGFTTGATGWAMGDTDNSGGPVSLADVQRFLAAYQTFQALPPAQQLDLGTGQDLAPSTGAVPEPGAASVALGAAALLTRPGCRPRRA